MIKIRIPKIVLETAFLILCLAGSACTPAGGVPGGAPSPQAEPSPQPTPTLAGPWFSPVLDDPILSRAAAPGWYAGSVEPGAVLFHAGQYHLFFNGIADWPGKAAVGYAASADGLAWQVRPSPVLDSAAGGFDGFTYFVSSVLQLEGGEWAMYLYTLDEGRDAAPGAILMATAPAPDGAWTLNAEPILLPGAPGMWDGSRVTQPSVIQAGGEYRMYFAGYAGDTLQAGRSIGLATSPDGYTWTKLPDPLLTPSADGRAWDFRRVFQPRVIAVPDGFLMLYKSNISVGRAEGWGLAASLDGLAWSPCAGNPIITEDTYPAAWRRNGIADLLWHEGALWLFLEILEREGGAYHHGNSSYFSNIFLLSASWGLNQPPE